MATETLYSDGNAGSGVTVTNGSNADGVQDGNFASANGGWRAGDSWEFTMDDTGLTDAQIAGATSIVMDLRYYMSALLSITDQFSLDVWNGSLWIPLEVFTSVNQPEVADPGDYVEAYDLSPTITTAALMNGIKFRFTFVPAGPYTGTVYVDSIRIVTTYTIAGKTHLYGPTFFLTSFLPAYRRKSIVGKVSKMKRNLSVGSLVGGTALEILSAAIIYAGIEAEDNLMITIGAAMFLIGFTIMKLRGSVKKAEQQAEEKAQDDRVIGYIDHFINYLLPDYITGAEREKLGEALYNLFGFELEEELEDEPGNMK